LFISDYRTLAKRLKSLSHSLVDAFSSSSSHLRSMKRVCYGMTAMCFLYEESLDKMEDMSSFQPNNARKK
jgi:hypothetical protein